MVSLTNTPVSCIVLNGILRRGDQYLPGPRGDTHILHATSSKRFLNEMASYSVLSNICQARKRVSVSYRNSIRGRKPDAAFSARGRVYLAVVSVSHGGDDDLRGR